MTDSPAPVAVRTSPANFHRMLVNGAFFQAGKTITSPHLLLPWVMIALGAPNLLVALVLPLWRAARFVSRLVSAAWVDRQAVVRPIILSSLLTRMAVLAAMAAVLASFQGAAAFAVVILSAVVFGAAEGIGPASGRRQMAKTIDKGAVGRLLSLQSVLAGAVTLALIAGHLLVAPAPGSQGDYLTHLALSAIAFTIAFFAAAQVREPRSPPREARRSGFRWPRFALLGDDELRSFTIASALGQSIILAPPFFAMVVAGEAGHSKAVLVFIAGLMIGGMLGGSLWSRLIAGGAQRVVGAAFATATVATLYVVVMDFEDVLTATLAYVPAFLLAGAASSGFRAVEGQALLTRTEEHTLAEVSAVVNSVTSLAGIFLAFAIGLVAHTAYEEAGLAVLAGLQILGALA